MAAANSRGRGPGGVKSFKEISRLPIPPRDSSMVFNRMMSPSPMPLPLPPLPTRTSASAAAFHQSGPGPGSARGTGQGQNQGQWQGQGPGQGQGQGQGQFSLPVYSPSPSSQDREVEIQLEDMEKLGLLGCGSGGKVYKVRHRRTGKVYALKIIQGKHEPALRERIIKEMEILQGVKSRNVVQCFGVYERGGEISFLLEYMDGKSLADVLLDQKKLPEDVLAEMMKQVLAGLEYLHKRKIVHRDIKPSNLLLNRRQEVKIADFGVSTVLVDTMALCESFVGTHAYMSPERINSLGNYDGYSADIWSLGLTLLECAIGRFPCLQPGEKPDWPTLMWAICLGEPPAPPPNASLEFQDFIRRCLQKDPRLRPRAKDLLMHPFLHKYHGNYRSPDLTTRLHSLQL